jgi:ethanolamine ammonia-lyase large subunit
MDLKPYDIVKLYDPPLYAKIVAFASTIDLTQDQIKIRATIEKFIMEKVSQLLLNQSAP